jgi:predicted nucleotide-binding protein
MKVFISWSGTLSHRVATLLRDWLPNVLQAVEPWLSSEDIAPGERWSNEIWAALEAVEVGIICLTAENVRSPWLLFEAGAISKQQRVARMCVYAVDVPLSEIRSPLAQFQVNTASRDDTFNLVQSLNSALGTASLSEDRLRRSFEVWWPVLDGQLSAAIGGGKTTKVEHKSLDEKVDEALVILKTLSGKLAEHTPTPPASATARPHRDRPRLFIGSSTEGLPVAEAIQLGLDHVAECTLWNQGVFELSSTTIETVVDAAAEFDFAILVLTPDDTTTRRGTSANSPRDNLIFELGLFTGILGRARTFLVYPRDAKLHLPSDLAGVTAATYASRSDGNLEAALGPVCTRIKRAMGTG